MKNKNKNQTVASKKMSIKKKILIGLAIFFGIGILGAALDDTSSSSTPAPTEIVTTAPTTAPIVTQKAILNTDTYEADIRDTINSALFNNAFNSVLEINFDYSSNLVSVKFKSLDECNNAPFSGGTNDIFSLLWELQEYLQNDLQITMTYQNKDVIKAVFKCEVIKDTNFSDYQNDHSFPYADISSLAEDWWQSDIITEILNK